MIVSLVVSMAVSFVVSLIMMKWHIYNINQVYGEYFDLENSNIEKFAEKVINKIDKH